MTHYYHYIAADGAINENTQFYSVGIGTSRQANLDYLFLIAYAAEHHHYFELFSERTMEFVIKCKKSLAPFIPYTVKISARDLVRALKHGERPAASSKAKHAQHLNLMQLNDDYRFFCNLSKRNIYHP